MNKYDQNRVNPRKVLTILILEAMGPIIAVHEATTFGMFSGRSSIDHHYSTLLYSDLRNRYGGRCYAHASATQANLQNDEQGVFICDSVTCVAGPA